MHAVQIVRLQELSGMQEIRRTQRSVALHKLLEVSVKISTSFRKHIHSLCDDQIHGCCFFSLGFAIGARWRQ